MKNGETGTLFVVATPIGNLEDITYRAVRVLTKVDLIAAEDTRHTTKLLAHYQIKKPLISCHEHNEQQRRDQLLDTLRRGENIALVSDAGTPTISDPGYQLVKHVAAQGLRVVPIPGPSAAVAGLSVAGLPTDAFLFMGFLHRKKGRRMKSLEEVKNEKATLIFYESPRRIIAFTRELLEVLGDRPAMLAREMTKIHEEFIRGTLSQILLILENRTIKGECVFFVGWEPPVMDAAPTARALDQILQEELAVAGEERLTRLAKRLSRQLNLSRQDIYQRLTILKNS